jgi:hypothetical protein
MFADLTCAIEDLHGIAVEGQAPNLSPDIQLCLLAAIDGNLNAIGSLVTRMNNALPEGQS